MGNCRNKGCGCGKKSNGNYTIVDPCNPTPCPDGEKCAEKISSDCVVMEGEWNTGSVILKNPTLTELISAMLNQN